MFTPRNLVLLTVLMVLMVPALMLSVGLPVVDTNLTLFFLHSGRCCTMLPAGSLHSCIWICRSCWCGPPQSCHQQIWQSGWCCRLVHSCGSSGSTAVDWARTPGDVLLVTGVVQCVKTCKEAVDSAERCCCHRLVVEDCSPWGSESPDTGLCQPWLLVSPQREGFGDSDILDAFADVGCHGLCTLVGQCVDCVWLPAWRCPSLWC